MRETESSFDHPNLPSIINPYNKGNKMAYNPGMKLAWRAPHRATPPHTTAAAAAAAASTARPPARLPTCRVQLARLGRAGTSA